MYISLTRLTMIHLSFSVLSSFNLIQHVNFLTHSKNHIRDLVITFADSSLAPSLSTSQCSPSNHFPIFTILSVNYTPLPLQRNIHFASYTLLTLMICSQMCCHLPSLLALRNLSVLVQHHSFLITRQTCSTHHQFL